METRAQIAPCLLRAQQGNACGAFSNATLFCRVAVMEDANRMSSNSLAIIFAPCLLRCPANYDLQTTLKEVFQTITCVEMLIKER
ncbi:hypothetical protein FKM82_023657 [Ascaphus truei]